MQNHYEINVSKRTGNGWNGEMNYVHFFATAERSCTSKQHVAEVYETIIAAFPEPEYKVTVTQWEVVGHHVTF